MKNNNGKIGKGSVEPKLFSSRKVIINFVCFVHAHIKKKLTLS